MLNNKISGGQAGVVFDGVGITTFRGNEVSGTKAAGVTLQAGAATHVASNHIRDCEGGGLVIIGLGTKGLLEGNTLTGCKVGCGGAGGIFRYNSSSCWRSLRAPGLSTYSPKGGMFSWPEYSRRDTLYSEWDMN